MIDSEGGDQRSHDWLTGSRRHSHILWFHLLYFFLKSLSTCRIPDFAWILRHFVYSSHAIAPADNTLVFVSRYIDATWRGEYIIPGALKRPVPVVVVPDDPELGATLTQQFRTVQLGTNLDGGVDLAEVKFGTDKLKKLIAWSPLYKSVQGRTNYQAQQRLKAELQRCEFVYYAADWIQQSMTARMKART